jgi:hypothetical protein
MNWVALAISLTTLATAIVGFVRVYYDVKQVHVLVNSNLTKVMDKLGIEQDTSAGLREELRIEREP